MKIYTVILFVAIFALFWTGIIVDEGSAQITLSEKKLTGGSGAFNGFGSDVSISGDTAIIGAFGDGLDFQGAAHVFERNNGGIDNWGEVKKLKGSDTSSQDKFGNAVSISSDTIVVGSFTDMVFSTSPDSPVPVFGQSGSAFVFERNQGGANNWGEIKKLIPSDISGTDQFGVSVSISGDTLVVGSHHDDDACISVPLCNSGSAYVFERNQGGANNWGEVTKLTASDAAATDNFGRSVSIYGDTIVIGSPGDGLGSQSGSVYVFDRNQGGVNNWGEVIKLTASDATAEDGFGFSVSIYGDTIVIGSPGDDDAGSQSGSAYLFERNQGGANNWGEVTKLTASDAASPNSFGFSVSVWNDQAIIGSPRDGHVGPQAGSAYVFERNQGGVNNWGEVTKLTASDAAATDNFGRSASNSGDILIGSPFDNNFAGSGYLYLISIDSVPPTIEIIAPNDGDIIALESFEITGTASDSLSGVSEIRISFDGGNTFSIAQGTTSWSFTANGLPDGANTITAIALDNAGLSSQTSITITKDTTPPIISITNPADGDFVTSNSMIITGIASDASGVSLVQFSTDGGATFSDATGTDSWSSPVIQLSDGIHTIVAQATDNAGNTFQTSIQITINDHIATFRSNIDAFQGLFGEQIASGDLNNDGFDDIIVDHTKTGEFNDLPTIKVFYGSPDIFAITTGIITSSDAEITLDPNDILSNEDIQLTIGDLNNDKIDDLIVGLISVDIVSHPSAGEVRVFYGAQGTFDVIEDLKISHPDPTLNGHFGIFLGIGDFDGDNLNDLAVGSEDSGSPANSGPEVNVYLGADGFGPLPSITIERVGVTNFAESGTVGDLNNDGFDDLIIGDSAKNLNGNSFAGQAEIFEGSASFDNTAEHLLQMTLPVQGAWFGFAMDSGDVNGDGIDDLVIAAPNLIDGNFKGKAFGYLGNPIFDTNLDFELLGSDTTKADGFGRNILIESVTQGNFANDIIIGDTDVTGGSSNPGVVHIFEGGSSLDTQVDSLLTEFSGSQSGRFGDSITSGDVNRDGVLDLMISEPSILHTIDISNFRGDVHVFSCIQPLSATDFESDGIIDECDSDDDNDGIFDVVDSAQFDSSNDDFGDGFTTGTVTRGDASLQIFDVSDDPLTAINEGVRIKVGSGTVNTVIQGNGICQTDPPVTIAPIDLAGADFVLSCGSLSTQVLQGTVKLSTSVNGQQVSIVLNQGQGATLDAKNNELLITNLSNKNPLTITIGDKTITLGPGEEINLSSPRKLMQTAFDDLKTIQINDKKATNELYKAIKSLQQSLDDKLWIDDFILEAKHGNKVFDESKKTVKSLLKIQSNNSELSRIITNIVNANEKLVLDAIQKAQDEYGGETKSDKEIENAIKEFQKAKQNLNNGDLDKAIDDFKKVWKHAQKAMKHDDN